jgi:hypothetical protein
VLFLWKVSEVSTCRIKYIFKINCKYELLKMEAPRSFETSLHGVITQTPWLYLHRRENLKVSRDTSSLTFASGDQKWQIFLAVTAFDTKIGPIKALSVIGLRIKPERMCLSVTDLGSFHHETPVGAQTTQRQSGRRSPESYQYLYLLMRIWQPDSRERFGMVRSAPAAVVCPNSLSSDFSQA